MVARDDSVIRGSLIASLIFLVLSIALNVFLWQSSNTQRQTAANAQDQLRTTQNNVRGLNDQTSLMKAMLGAGTPTEAEFETLAQSVSEDPDMEALLLQYRQDMGLFGQEIEPQNRNYVTLSDYLVTSIRQRNTDTVSLRSEVDTTRAQAESDVANARKLQQVAEDARDAKAKDLETETDKFNERRKEMELFTAQAQDMMRKQTEAAQQAKRTNLELQNRLQTETNQLQNTVNMLRSENNQLRGGQFDVAQGNVVYTVPGGNVVTIDLGSSDALRPGVTFGVIDGDEPRISDADVKATIQVTRVRGPNSAEARIVARPKVSNPVIPGDKLFSPFWAPGRTIKIALAGDIDVDGDGKADNAAIRGMIAAAGAELVAEVSSAGEQGEIDSSTRFLVVGETPEVGENAGAVNSRENAELVKQVGEMKARANQLGVSVIPAWKMEAFLQTMDNTLTTPLGSAVSGSDFPPLSNPDATGRRPQNDLPDIYRRQLEGVQQSNRISR